MAQELEAPGEAEVAAEAAPVDEINMVAVKSINLTYHW
eukprot:CAMPEP_0185902624 /NCGR_PEP_ID=MMETSP0196C-20130402/1844_1 /TAXON_ID=2932 /ORGANISM="Alexandrium fundyense, Strain CCMP1719" /LENGTH=37 /DNA_ID= /DNA_START= /DNA_END= /DNA_ORIENTATION=